MSFKTKAKRAIKDYCSVDSWKDRFPITRWLPQYKPSKGISDIIAGLTVGLTVLPQGLAYASIAKLPLEVSLIIRKIFKRKQIFHTRSVQRVLFTIFSSNCKKLSSKFWC